MKSWKFERFSIYSVLVIAVVTTVFVFMKHFTRDQMLTVKSIAVFLADWYAHIISFGLAGMLGVGLYPLFGTRVWCRFFCPMAGMLGIFQNLTFPP